MNAAKNSDMSQKIQTPSIARPQATPLKFQNTKSEMTTTPMDVGVSQRENNMAKLMTNQSSAKPAVQENQFHGMVKAHLPKKTQDFSGMDKKFESKTQPTLADT